MRKTIFLTAVLWVMLATGLQGQYYSSGMDPAALRWRQIETPDFRLVYPEYADSIAQHFARSLLWATQQVQESYGIKPRKIDILIHTEAATSNGMVAWAPRRMEIYSTLPQDIYPQDWFEQLALHEYRHVVQMSQMEQGLSKILYYLFGEQLSAALIGLYVPLWFLEGDAVYSETMYSKAGRGRANYFADALKQQVLHYGPYSYDKATMGSYKDFVPNHYILGYHLVAQARKDYGDSLWSECLKHVARHPLGIVSFSRSLKKQSGLNKSSLYRAIMDTLFEQWEREKSHYRDYRPDILHHSPGKDYVHYNYPAQINDSCFFALRSGMDDVVRFVSINVHTGQEKILYSPGVSSYYSCSFCDSVICWSEPRYDKRWEHRRYWVLLSYDLRSRKKTVISRHSRLWAPELNAAADKVVCVEQDVENHYFISIYDLHKKVRTQQYRIKYFPITPVFSADEKGVYFIGLVPDKGQGIYYLDLAEGSISTVMNPSYYQLSSLVPLSHELLYEAEYDGVLNAYSLDLQSGDIRRESHSARSIIDLSITDGSDLLYALYTADGFRIARSNRLKEPYTISSRQPSVMIGGMPRQPQIENGYSRDTIFTSLPYRKWKHLVNIHSWMPAAINLSNYTLSPGLSVMSQNLLNSMSLIAGYRYNINESRGSYYLTATYRGLYPELSTTLEGGKRRSTVYDSSRKAYEVQWKENSQSFLVSLPLTFSNGKYYRHWTSQVSIYHRAVDYYGENSGLMHDGYLFTGSFETSFSNIRRYTSRDIMPRWGQRLRLSYNQSLGGDMDAGRLTAAELSVYLPGIGRHHSLKGYAGVQQKNTGDYQFTDAIRYPRMALNINYGDFYALQADYSFPLWYPDKSLGSLFYFKRLRANLFIDYASGIINNKADAFSAYGAELLLDGHWLRFIAPSFIGLRYSHSPHYGAREYKILFGINFNDI